jgi:hypothetical protein
MRSSFVTTATGCVGLMLMTAVTTGEMTTATACRVWKSAIALIVLTTITASAVVVKLGAVKLARRRALSTYLQNAVLSTKRPKRVVVVVVVVVVLVLVLVVVVVVVVVVELVVHQWRRRQKRPVLLLVAVSQWHQSHSPKRV